jgi:hypothetical protein
MGTIAVIDNSLLQEAEKQLKLAVKLRVLSCETGNPAVERAYRLAMLRYMEKMIALGMQEPEYVDSLHDAVVERMHFLERKLDGLMQLAKTPSWSEKLFTQFEATLRDYEVVYDQAVALGWEPPCQPLPEAKYACYQDSGLCRLAQNQPLTACVYSSENCHWRVRSREKP